jgi:general secretion pathway protein N
MMPGPASRILAALAAAWLCTAPGRAAEDQSGSALANPVARVQLEDLSATRERPLFAASRRLPTPPPPPPPVTVVPEPVPLAPPAPPPELTLFGIVGDPEGARANVRGGPSNEIRRVRVGDTIGEWVVAEIGPRNLLLRLGDRSATFQLFSAGASKAPVLIPTAKQKQKGAPPDLFSTPGRTLLPPQTAGKSKEWDGL